MRLTDLPPPCLIAVLLVPFVGWSQTPARSREQFKNADVIYGWTQDNAGHNLRMFVTRPKKTAGKVPAIFFVGWLSCDSVEYPQGETDGFGAIFWRLIEQTGYATVRVDKPASPKAREIAPALTSTWNYRDINLLLDKCSSMTLLILPRYLWSG